MWSIFSSPLVLGCSQFRDLSWKLGVFTSASPFQQNLHFIFWSPASCCCQYLCLSVVSRFFREELLGSLVCSLFPRILVPWALVGLAVFNSNVFVSPAQCDCYKLYDAAFCLSSIPQLWMSKCPQCQCRENIGPTSVLFSSLWDLHPSSLVYICCTLMPSNSWGGGVSFFFCMLSSFLFFVYVLVWYLLEAEIGN